MDKLTFLVKLQALIKEANSYPSDLQVQVTATFPLGYKHTESYRNSREIDNHQLYRTETKQEISEETQKWLDQFKIAKEEINSWPKWMQDNAKSSAATWPKTKG